MNHNLNTAPQLYKKYQYLRESKVAHTVKKHMCAVLKTYVQVIGN